MKIQSSLFVACLAALVATVAAAPAALAFEKGPGTPNSKARSTPIKSRFHGSSPTFRGSFHLDKGLKVGGVNVRGGPVKPIAIASTQYVRPVTFRGVTNTNQTARAKAGYVRSGQWFRVEKINRVVRAHPK